MQPRRRLGVRALVGACVVLAHGVLPAGAWAQEPAAHSSTGTAGSQSGPSWSALTAAQRSVLAPLERDWHGIEPSRKSKWLELAARYPSLSTEEQGRVQLRMAEWARLTPAERGRARLAFQETKQLSREEKQARWEAYKSLPESERSALAARGHKAAANAGAPARPVQGSGGTAASAAAPAPAAQALKPVAPTLVQAKPGATTMPMNKSLSRPASAPVGQPHIAVQAKDVDRATLLPRSGPQAASSAPALRP